MICGSTVTYPRLNSDSCSIVLGEIVGDATDDNENVALKVISLLGEVNNTGGP